MKIVITIDTEEDDWSNYSRKDYTLRNISRIPILQELFDRFGAKPTYLITYPVATDPGSVEILKKIIATGKCEIGAHCHPWNTPPFEEDISPFNSMLCNLPKQLVTDKITTLHEAIRKNFQVTPVIFRAGRWSLSSAVASAITQLGYHIDTSVTPLRNWNESSGCDYSDYPTDPYHFSPANLRLAAEDAPLLEVPVTIGFTQKYCSFIRSILNRFDPVYLKKLHIEGILERLHLYNKVWLSPEHSNAPLMIALAKRLCSNHNVVLNMSFHSTTLIGGLTPFVKSEADELKFLKRIETFLCYAKKAGDEFVFLSDLNKYY